MKSNYKAKLNSALHGIEIAYSKPDDSSLTLLETIISPPGYMVKMVLSYLYGHSLPSGGDKSEWQIPLIFKGLTFILTDYKRYKCKIYGQKNGNLVGTSLRKKLEIASNIMNSYISEESKAYFDAEDIFLQNNYYKISSIYDDFYEQLELMIAESPSKKVKCDGVKDIGHFLNMEIERKRKINGYLIATTLFFFAITEVLLDACFALGDRQGLTYKEFRSLDWSTRFKMFFDLSSDASLSSDYNDLLQVRRYYRNVPVHGDPVFFFPLKDFGLIPANYDSFNTPQMMPSFSIEKADVRDYLRLYDRVISYFSCGESSKYAYIYVESDFPIPIRKKSAEELKKYMTSQSEFEEELRHRSLYQDALDNMEI